MTRTQPRNSNTTEDDLETVSPTIEKKEGTKYQDEIPIINISNKPCQFRNTDDWAEYTLRCSRMVSSSCSSSGTRRVNLVTNPVISRE
jgi:hypothetical protein